MTVLQPYKDALNVETEERLVELFLNTLVVTNRTHDFFVDWNKVYRNVDSLKTEIALLGSLRGSKSLESELRQLIHKYPEVTKAIPILIAVRDLKFNVLEDIEAAQQCTEYDFSKPALADADIGAVVRFCTKTGITSLLTSIQTLRDYVTGVEVGTDTNARKNRSGSSMENLLFPILRAIGDKNPGITVIVEKKFSELAPSGPWQIPAGLRDRRFDLVVLTPGHAFNVETNFYSGGGSKPQEIVDSYINRHRELAQAGWGFIWVTDGDGWRSGVNQIRKGFKDMDFVLNLHFVRQGVLSRIITAPGQLPH